MNQRSASRVLMGSIFFALAACSPVETPDDPGPGGLIIRPNSSNASTTTPTNTGDIDSPGPTPGPAPGPTPGYPSTTPPRTPGNCSYTQGYWKNHAGNWPVSQLTLGQVVYTKAQLLSIFRTPVEGNGLIALAHQLIAARLNLAHGAAPLGLEATLAQADALIGALVVPPVGDGKLATTNTSALNDALTAFNEGKTGPGHCDKGEQPPPSGPPDAGAPPSPYPVTPPVTPPVVVE